MNRDEESHQFHHIGH